MPARIVDAVATDFRKAICQQTQRLGHFAAVMRRGGGRHRFDRHATHDLAQTGFEPAHGRVPTGFDHVGQIRGFVLRFVDRPFAPLPDRIAQEGERDRHPQPHGHGPCRAAPKRLGNAGMPGFLLGDCWIAHRFDHEMPLAGRRRYALKAKDFLFCGKVRWIREIPESKMGVSSRSGAPSDAIARHFPLF